MTFASVIVAGVVAWIVFAFLEMCLTIILETKRLSRPSPETYDAMGFALAWKLAPLGPGAVPVYLYAYRKCPGIAIALMAVHIPLYGAFVAGVGLLLHLGVRLQ